MKTNIITINTIMTKTTKYICAVVMLLGMSVSAWGLTINLNTSTNVFELSTSSTNDASSEISKTVGGYTYKLKAADKCYFYDSKALFIGKSESYITFPAISGKKLTSVTIWNCSGAGAPSISICPTDNTTAVSGGTATSVSAGSSQTWTLSGTSANTSYRAYITDAKNLQMTGLQLVYSNTSAYTVSFSAISGTPAKSYIAEASGSAGVTLPDVDPSDEIEARGWGFFGWATSSNKPSTTTSAAPSIVGKAGDTYYPESDETLYAVYAKGEFTKVTSTGGITSGGKYIIVGDDNNEARKQVWQMGDNYYPQGPYYYMQGHLLGQGDSRLKDSYHTTDLYSGRYIITGSAGSYVIKDEADTKYVDVKETNWFTASSTRKNAITFGDGGLCTIANNSGGYLVVFIGGSFGDNGSSWSRMLLYKETTSSEYSCNPPDATLTLVASPAAGGTVVFDDNSSDEMDFVSADGYIGDIIATPNSGYEFLYWESSVSGSEIEIDPTDEAEAAISAETSATITAYFYQNHSITYTLTGVDGDPSNPTTVTKDEMDGFVSGFDMQAHYKEMTLASVTMGGTPLTEGAEADYEWEETDGTAMLTIHHDNINGDIVITVSATHMEYTKYAFSCAELTLTPVLVTPGTPIFITSAANKTVRSQDYIEISGNGLTPSTELTFPGLPSKFAIKNADGTAISTDGSGEVSANAYIFYNPGATTEDGLDHITGITVSVGGAKPKQATLSQDIYGRHLPADFVIAAKKDGKWWAMPANMSSTTNPTPVEISVDNATNPSIAYTLSNTYYGLAGPTAANISSGNGQYIRFAMSIDDGTLDPHAAPLFGYSTGSTTLGKSGNSQISSDLSAGNWWKLVQTNTSITNPQDAKYTIYCANNTQSLTLEDGGKWGLYATNGTDVDELRLVPARSGVSYEEAEIVEWGQHGAIVEVDTHFGYHTKVKAKLNGAETGFITLSETKTSVSKVDTKYNYTVNFGDGIDFAAAASNGAMLTLEWYNTSEVLQSVSNITVPKIIASSATMSSIESGDTPWSKWEVHVLPGVTLDANAGSFSSSDVVINNLQLYPGAILKVTTGTLVVTNLSLRNGWRRVGVAEPVYAAPRIQIKTTANLRHTNAYLDWYIDNDQFYPVAVPFPVKVSTITYLNTNNSVTVGGTSGVIRLRYFDGENRAAGNSGNWKYYGAVGCTAVPDTLKPSMGYALAAMRPGGKAFSILRMPLIYTDEWTALGEQASVVIETKTYRKDTVHVYAYGTGQTAEWNKGWNLIGNPYMSVFNGNDDGISGKLLYVTNVDDPKKDKVRYVTIPNSSFTDYSQVNITEANIRPFSSFLIQAKDTSAISFSKSKIEIPSAPAHYTATPASLPEQEVYIRLSNEEASDQMGLIIGEDYTAEYETDADLAKMHGELNTLKTYMVYDNVDMAYLAINEQLAQEWIPVTVRVPASNQYTFSLHEASVVGEMEGIYLIDYESNTITNLIENNYSFVAAGGTIEGRFAINAIAGQHETPTDIDIINAGGDIHSDKPVKFLYHDKVFIYHRGVIYDATGKKVREINK